jgi:hypothetical protein
MHSSPDLAHTGSAGDQRVIGTARVWNRKLHYYLGLYLLFFLWLFAITGLVLNHGTWIPSPQSGRTVVNYDHSIQRLEGNGALDDARSVMRQLNIEGEIDWVATPAAPGRFDFRVSRPGGNHEIKVDLNAGTASVQRTNLNGWNVTRILHTFTGVRAADARSARDWIVTTIWALAMDAVALGLVLMVATSLWMWWNLKGKRSGGAAALALGCLVCGWFVAGLRWFS